jgi:hypothetical protein
MSWRSYQSATSTPFALDVLYLVEHGTETVGGSCLHGGCRKGGVCVPGWYSAGLLWMTVCWVRGEQQLQQLPQWRCARVQQCRVVVVQREFDDGTGA